MASEILLRDPETFPSEKVLKEVLGKKVYGVLESFFGIITGEGYGLVPEWRFYNDGKAWLGKVTYKNKTVLWLSIWEGYFKVSFHFTPKHKEAVAALDISKSVREDFAAAEPSGKLIPLIFDVDNATQLDDLLTVARFKKSVL